MTAKRVEREAEGDLRLFDMETIERLPQEAATARRDNAWLEERLRLLWEMHFSDVPVGFPIVVAFGTRAKYRFGSIMARDGKSLITVNRLFTDPFVPVYVVDGTLVHELAHYVHGFGSGLPRLYRHPHRGGVIDKELEKRGLGELDRKAGQWREAHWDAFYARCCEDLTARRSCREDDVTARWVALLMRPDFRTEAELHGRLTLLAGRLGFAPDAPLPFRVEWLRATRRQRGLSYWYARSRVVRLHGMLADRRVPGAVVDFELAYWLAQRATGGRWPIVRGALLAAGFESMVEEAMHWRRYAWTAFCNRHHPLAASNVQKEAGVRKAAAHKTDRK